ncbi:hypothetical protein [Azospirillum doebereinerae]|uniref:Uncharacterized protein n=1 Tax=Azospirillum doebereinerae TaxID=92933 RepID=A0A3S0V5U9_9PROT|nr:hypothetical protein [Azospirillum doebereinerae]MCG5241793.1 hypothetical protein [Azospirillum doebereinerae]RUQ70129.1 hypothetical protein EJ913_14060 [Azospirillum doebereinerae]
MQISGYLASVYGQFRSSGISSVQGRLDTSLEDTSKVSAADAFIKEAQKTPAQRIREELLARHKLTEDGLATMEPEQRKAIEKEIADELKRRLTGKDDRRGAAVDLTA